MKLSDNPSIENAESGLPTEDIPPSCGANKDCGVIQKCSCARLLMTKTTKKLLKCRLYTLIKLMRMFRFQQQSQLGNFFIPTLQVRPLIRPLTTPAGSIDVLHMK